MIGQRPANKEDKRMLVLFAFGIIVLLFDVVHLVQPFDQGGRTVEQPERIEGARPPVLTPRRAFFLNQPMPINQAAAQDLILLPGIGEQLAERIIAFRDKNGGIADPGDLEQVAGVGKKLSRRISRFVTFSQP